MENEKIKKAKSRTKVPKRSSCPLCGCKELLTEGPDQFCVSCDWDTCAEYVQRGWMDNLEMASFAHFPPKPTSALQVCSEADTKTQALETKKPA